MKLSILLSGIAVVAGFACYAQQSGIPDPSLDLDACLSWAQTQPGTAASTRCYGLDDCQRNRSDTAEELRECQNQVEFAYQKAIGVVPPGAPSAVATPVVTDPADSYYDTQTGGDSKGWERANQGE